MSKTWKQSLREVLDKPFKQKPWWFLTLLPLLFFISAFISFIAMWRRKCSYVKYPENCQMITICVGNILIGGTGKSPLVRRIAEIYLEKGYSVAIMSRGITNYNKQLYVHGTETNPELINHLSDENREHFEILKEKKLHKNLWILQYKKRSISFDFFFNKLKSENKEGKAIAILDDGLQHFSCPRLFNFCVWQPKLLSSSPLFSLPIGPYREGFGKQTFYSLLKEFDLRFWSRCLDEDKPIFTEDIKKILANFNLSLNTKDIIIQYKTKLLKINKITHILEHINSPCDLNNVLVFCGIAQPDAFFASVEKKIKCLSFKKIFLSDHANFSEATALLSKQQEILTDVIMTRKDYCRWMSLPEFHFFLKNKNIYILDLEINFDFDLYLHIKNSISEQKYA